MTVTWHHCSVSVMLYLLVAVTRHCATNHVIHSDRIFGLLVIIIQLDTSTSSSDVQKDEVWVSNHHRTLILHI